MRLPFRIEFHACNCKPRTLVDSVSMTVVTQEAYDSGVNWLSPTHDKCFLRRTPRVQARAPADSLEAVKCPIHERTP
jgi:hypothetical protein